MKRVTVSERFLLPGPNPGPLFHTAPVLPTQGFQIPQRTSLGVTALVRGEGKKTYAKDVRLCV